MKTPVGELSVTVASSSKGIVWIGLDDERESSEVFAELSEAFSGVALVEKCEDSHNDVCRFLEGDDTVKVALDLRGTPFTLKVWDELKKIPFGVTITYRDLACRLGLPTSARAVGNAVAANRIAFLVPCHRVVPCHGGTGHFRWGDALKRRLLECER